MFLIYAKESDYPPPETVEGKELLDAFWAVDDEAKEKGVFVAADPLTSVATATTVRVRGGEILTTDGPFAETKEQLGGYYILDCADLDEAVAWATKIPTAGFGSVEVRPVVDVERT